MHVFGEGWGAGRDSKTPLSSRLLPALVFKVVLQMGSQW